MGSFDDQMGLPSRRPTEAEQLQLSKEGLEISKFRLLETLRRTEGYLLHEQYTCLTPVVLSLGPCSLVRRVSYYSLDKEQTNHFFVRETEGPTSGPAYLLCGQPTVGGPPYECAEHWLWGRGVKILKQRRLRREFNKSKKKLG